MKDRFLTYRDGKTVAIRDLPLSEVHRVLETVAQGKLEFDGVTSEEFRERLLIELCARDMGI